MEKAIGEYVANHHVVFCKNAGLVTIPEPCNDLNSLKVLVSNYIDWCYQVDIIPNKEAFCNTLYELGIIGSKMLRGIVSPFPEETIKAISLKY